MSGSESLLLWTQRQWFQPNLSFRCTVLVLARHRLSLHRVLLGVCRWTLCSHPLVWDTTFDCLKARFQIFLFELSDAFHDFCYRFANSKSKVSASQSVSKDSSRFSWRAPATMLRPSCWLKISDEPSANGSLLCGLASVDWCSSSLYQTWSPSPWTSKWWLLTPVASEAQVTWFSPTHLCISTRVAISCKSLLLEL